MVAEEIAETHEEIADLAGAGVGADLHRELDRDPLAARVVDELHLRKLGVGDRDERLVEPTDPRRTQADLFDPTANIAILAFVADPHRLVGEQDDAGDQILDRVLRRQRHGQAARPEPGEERRYWDAEGIGRLDADPGDDDKRANSTRQPEELHVDPVAAPCPGPDEDLRNPRHDRHHRGDGAGVEGEAERELGGDERVAGEPHLKGDEPVSHEAADGKDDREEKARDRAGPTGTEDVRQRRGEEGHEAEDDGEHDRRAPLPNRLAEDHRVGPGREGADERLGDQIATDGHVGVVEPGAAGIRLVRSASHPSEEAFGPCHRFGGEDKVPLAWAGFDPHEHDLGSGDPPTRDRVGLHAGSIGNGRVCRDRDPVEDFFQACGGLAPL